MLDRLHARTHFHFVPGRNHGDVYTIGKDRYGLMKKIAWRMHAIARPHGAPHPPAHAERADGVFRHARAGLCDGQRIPVKKRMALITAFVGRPMICVNTST